MLEIKKSLSNPPHEKGDLIQLSIVTAFRNSDKSLERTLNSVRNQKSPSDVIERFEHILIDGLSTDSSLSIAHEYCLNANHACAVFSQKDRGIADGFNRGVIAARGRWIWFLNGDDALADSESVARVLLLCEQADLRNDLMVASSIYEFDSDTRKIMSVIPAIPSRIRDGMYMPHPGLAVRRDLFEKYGLFSESFKISMDYEWLLRVIQRSKLDINSLAVSDTPVVAFSRGGISTIGGPRIWLENLSAQILHIGGWLPFKIFIFSMLKHSIAKN